MSKEEIVNFLSHGTMTAKVSTVSSIGLPHVAPVWFVIDDIINGVTTKSDNTDLVLVFTTSDKSLKAKHLLENPRICVCVDDQTPPFSFVIINGIAEIESSPKQYELLQYTTKLAERYMGKEKAEKFGKRNAVDGELIIRIKPTKIIAQKDVSD